MTTIEARARRSIATGAACFLLLAGACTRSLEQRGSGETRFLSVCSMECGSDLSCLGGLCTRACADSDACSGLGGDATCEALPTGASAGDIDRACDRLCTRDRDCNALGEAFACRDGRCRAPVASDSGVPAPDVVSEGGMGDPDGAPRTADATAGEIDSALGVAAATPGEVDGASALCGVSEDGTEPIADMEALTSHLVGRWLWCSGVRLFSREDVSGIRIDADQTWRFLLPGPDGGFVEGAGFDNAGTWSVTDIPGNSGATRFQVNLDSTGIGGIGAFPYFATAPAKMRLSTMVGVCDYASLDAR